MFRLSWNLVVSTSWNPQGLSRPVQGFLYEMWCGTRLLNKYQNFEEVIASIFTIENKYHTLRLVPSKSGFIHTRPQRGKSQIRAFFIVINCGDVKSHTSRYSIFPPSFYFLILSLITSYHFIARLCLFFTVSFTPLFIAITREAVSCFTDIRYSLFCSAWSGNLQHRDEMQVKCPQLLLICFQQRLNHKYQADVDHIITSVFVTRDSCITPWP